MLRRDGRNPDALRPIRMTRNYLKDPEGSVFIEMGETKVICTASIEERIPAWMKNGGVPGGWITAEYGMLPRATNTRTNRDIGRPNGRTMEIQRLIGRSLRSVVDMTLLGERTIWLDCDVIQADGGTRTASISGAFVAMVDAISFLNSRHPMPRWPVQDFLAAVSVGIVDGRIQLDLNYEEDSRAEVDMNIVMTGNGNFVELQATGERKTFSGEELAQLLAYGKKGIGEIVSLQREQLSALNHHFSALSGESKT